MITDYLAFSPAADTAMDGPFTEMINSSRAYAYAEAAGIAWLNECDRCPDAHPTATYTTPAADDAPWYDPTNPDTERFLGVIGMDIEGADTSTRIVNVSQTLGSGGAIGPPYHGPRTLVVRAIAIAQDECALQAGMDWLQFTFADEVDPCTADSLNYYDCCTDGDIADYRRQFRETRITEGPDFIEIHRSMPSGGALAVFELTFVAGDPEEYTPAELLLLFGAEE